MYKDKSFVSKIYLKRQLYNLEMKDGATIHEYFNEFNILLNDLLGINAKIDEKEQDTLLLYLMPDSWKNYIMSLSHVNLRWFYSSIVVVGGATEKVVVDNYFIYRIVGLGFRWDQRLNNANNNRIGEEKFKSEGDIKCYNYEKLGHIMKHCIKLVKDKKNGKGQQQKEANVVKFNELVMIFDCFHEHYGADYGSI